MMVPQDCSDEELVTLYKASRDHQYLSELFTRHSGVLYRSALRILKNASNAEDVLQTAYCKMIKDLPTYKGTGSVTGWMVQVVIHTSYERIRSEKSRLKRERKVMSERPQSTPIANDELNEMIEAHLNKLPEIYKVPIMLKIMEGLSIKEVSDALSIPEKTIRSQIERGLEKLKDSLERVGFTASIISVNEMLAGIHQPSTPEIFNSVQYFNNIFLKKSSISTKLAITASSKTFYIKFLFGTLFLTTFVTSLFLSRTYIFTEDSTPLLPINKTKLFKKWDFENIKDHEEFKVIQGAFEFKESVGVNSSKGLVIESDSVVEIDISKFKLPLKISYSYDYLMPIGGDKSYSGIAVLKGNYQKDKNIFNFTKFRPNRVIQISNFKRNKNAELGFIGQWDTANLIITEYGIDFYFSGKRTALMLGQSIDNKKLYFKLMHKYLIDDFIIESIEPEAAPSFNVFKEFADTYPFTKGAIPYFKLDIEKPPLNLEANSLLELGIFDSDAVEFNLGLNKKKDENVEP